MPHGTEIILECGALRAKLPERPRISQKLYDIVLGYVGKPATLQAPLAGPDGYIS